LDTANGGLNLLYRLIQPESIVELNMLLIPGLAANRPCPKVLDRDLQTAGSERTAIGDLLGVF